MTKTSLISRKTVQLPIQNGQRINRSNEIINHQVSQYIDTPSQTIPNREKKIKPKYNKQQLAIVPEVVYGQILEIDKDSVILRCLVDEDGNLFQKRRFDRQFFEKAVNLAINQLVEVKVYIRQGEVKFTFANSNRQDLTEKFAPKDYFSEFEGSILFQPLPQPLHIDADNF